MQNVSCLFSFQESYWTEFQEIAFNLNKSYNLDSISKTKNFNFSISHGLSEMRQLAQEIFEFHPDVIVFLDHQPHPLVLIALLISLYAEKPRPRFIFHIYGDFTLSYSRWEKLGHLLEGDKVDFIVPSQRQKKFFDRYLQAPNASILCPFPVDEGEFFFSPELRDSQRSKWGIKEDEFVFLYAGTLSRQKRIYKILKAFSAFILSENKTPCHLFLYGDADSIGDPYLDKRETEGEYFRALDRLFRSLPDEVRKNIHFMGNVSKEDLQSVYEGADALINLSVCNDQDYEMSVAQAQAKGLPSILSDWGGVAHFRHREMEEATCFVTVRIGQKSKLISQEETVKAFKTIRKLNQSERQSLSNLSLRKYGIKACHDILKKNLMQKNTLFNGFSPFFEQVAEETNWSTSPYISKTKKINNLFREIYSSYVRAD